MRLTVTLILESCQQVITAFYLLEICSLFSHCRWHTWWIWGARLWFQHKLEKSFLLKQASFWFLFVGSSTGLRSTMLTNLIYPIILDIMLVVCTILSPFMPTRWSMEAQKTLLSSFCSISQSGTSGENLTSSPALSHVEEVRGSNLIVSNCKHISACINYGLTVFKSYWSPVILYAALPIKTASVQYPPPGYQLNSAECTDIRSNQTLPEHHCNSYPENTKPMPKLKECNMDPCKEGYRSLLSVVFTSVKSHEHFYYKVHKHNYVQS